MSYVIEVLGARGTRKPPLPINPYFVGLQIAEYMKKQLEEVFA